MVILQWIRDFLHNGVVIGALSAWLIAQLLKMLIELIRYHKVSMKRLFGDGGMPSGHSACVAGLATSCAMIYGLNSPFFAIAGVLAVVVMHDATGVRQESGKQAKAINELRSALHPQYSAIQDEQLKELLGHNHIQVLFGAILGVIVGIISSLIMIRNGWVWYGI